MSDDTELPRRLITALINHEPGSREALEQEHGQVWDTDQLSQDFEVKGFMAPFVVVKRKSDSAIGSLMFQARPRFYFCFKEDTK